MPSDPHMCNIGLPTGHCRSLTGENGPQRAENIIADKLNTSAAWVERFFVKWAMKSIILWPSEALSSTNWTDVGATPVLNYTNLHYEVTGPAGGRAIFYRLASQ